MAGGERPRKGGRLNLSPPHAAPRRPRRRRRRRRRGLTRTAWRADEAALGRGASTAHIASHHLDVLIFYDL